MSEYRRKKREQAQLLAQQQQLQHSTQQQEVDAQLQSHEARERPPSQPVPCIIEFRLRFSEEITQDIYDDYFYLRWLRARKWNIDAAENMLRTAMKNRAMVNADSLHKWEPPSVLKQYLPYGIIGYDKDGSPIIVCPFYQFDIYGMLHCVTRFEFMRFIVKILEEITQMGYEKSLVHGYKARQVVVIFDVADFNLKQYTWRPAIELITNMIKQYEQNFPEILKMCYIINAPKLFSVGFNFIKKFLDDYTVSKISINKAGDKWKELAFTHIDPDILPKSFGGNLTENGDGRCPSKIVWGGKIPIELYVEQKDDDDSKSFLETTINKGNKLKLEFDTGVKREPEEDQILSWDFRTFGYDIKFGIYSIDKASGEKRSEVPLSTVFSNEMDEVGFISTRPNTKYTVVFDNSGSYLRSKKLRYSVALVSESDDITNLEPQVGQTEVGVLATI